MSNAFWKQIADRPVFCGFKEKVPVGIDGVDGLSAEDYTTRAGTYEQASSIASANYVGVSFMQPIEIDGKYLVCLDFDWKRSKEKEASPAQKAMIKKLYESGVAYEQSYSGSGCHFWVLVARDQIPCTINEGEGHEIEVFSGFEGQKRNVLITDREAAGEAVSIDLLDMFPQLTKYERRDYSIESNEVRVITPTELAKIRKAITHIPCGEGTHDTWKQVARSLQRVEGGEEIWIEWSLTAGLMTRKELEKTWRSLMADSRFKVHHETLFYIAYQHGYRESKEDRMIYEQEGYREVFYDQSMLKDTDYLIENFIAEGVLSIAGAAGVGKTNSLVTLSAQLTGFTEKSFLAPLIRRKVIYISEHTQQVEQIISALAKHTNGRVDSEEFRHWFRIFESKQITAVNAATLVAQLIEESTTVAQTPAGDFVIKPLVVFDTWAANFSIENENDNSEVGKVAEVLKRLYVDTGASVWLAGHTSKANKRGDLKDLSARGAGSLEAGVHMTAYLFKEEDGPARYLHIDKTRYEPDFREIKFVSVMHSDTVINRYGFTKEIRYFHCEISKSSPDERAAQKMIAKEIDLEQEMIDTIEFLFDDGVATTKNKIFSALSGDDGRKRQVFNKLVANNRISTVVVSPEIRAERNILSNAVKEIYRVVKGYDA
ncbi:Primase, C-terminal 2 [uncultured Caudovirales phage]|uniref:Primase, C-terminal 2 n=1 Tax=uncultured Caudovirales phage TaxID=2100421 RepID=A0A6J5LGE8_9CAUD|nr:Primase, C-terminal 2 [uncultured Caudovirales phage]